MLNTIASAQDMIFEGDQILGLGGCFQLFVHPASSPHRATHGDALLHHLRTSRPQPTGPLSTRWEVAATDDLTVAVRAASYEAVPEEVLALHHFDALLDLVAQVLTMPAKLPCCRDRATLRKRRTQAT